MPRKRSRTIEGDTPLMPTVVGDAVVNEVAFAFHAHGGDLGAGARTLVDSLPAQRALVAELSDAADARYRSDARFAKAMHGDRCREELFSWMRVETARIVAERLGPGAAAALPDGFDRGFEPSSPSGPTP